MGFVTMTAFAGLFGAVAGYLLADVVPAIVLLTLIFINIIYFVLMMAATRGLVAILVVIAGGVAGPLLHIVTADWGLLLSGLIGGTLAFGMARIWRDRHV